MTEMAVANFNWNGAQDSSPKGPAHMMVLFSRKGTSFKLLAIDLTYILEY